MKKKTTPKKPRNYGATEQTLVSTRKTRRDIRAVRAAMVEHAQAIGELRAQLDDLTERVNGLSPHAPEEPPGPEMVDGEPWRSA